MSMIVIVIFIFKFFKLIELRVSLVGESLPMKIVCVGGGISFMIHPKMNRIVLFI